MLREMLKDLHKPPQKLDYLYEMAAHSIDTSENSVFYDVNPNDTNFASLWFRQYNEVRNMAYDTVGYEKVESVIRHALDSIYLDSINPQGKQIGKKTPIGLIHVNYYRMKKESLEDSTIGDYFELDTINDKLTDLPGRAEEPFMRKKVFSASALNMSLSESEVTFVIDKRWMVTDSLTDIYFAPNTSAKFKIDFDDGNGYQYFDADKRHEIVIDYADSIGDRVVDFRLVNYINYDYEPGSAENQIESFFIPSPYEMLIGATYFHINVPYKTIAQNLGLIQPKNGFNVLIEEPCGASVVPGNNQQPRKIAVIVGGFDPLNTLSEADIWRSVGQNTQIEELRNHGYEFHIIKWGDSKRDMRQNAGYLIDYLDALKCELLNANPEDPEALATPMVVIGYSMGGVIANYALAKWENEPGVSSCHEEYLHFTRLLITLDAPHQGANVPLAYQHFYRNITSLVGMGLVDAVAAAFNEEVGLSLLEAKSAKQMLMYHIDTKLPFSNVYTMHPDRVEFLDELDALGGRPTHCKVFAQSNGSASGIRQMRGWDNAQRSPGDRFLDFSGYAYTRILFFKVPLFYAKVDLRSANGTNRVYESLSNLNFFRLRIRWTGIRITLNNVISPYISAHAVIHPYDVASGGFHPGLGFGYQDYNWKDTVDLLGIPIIHSFGRRTHYGNGEYKLNMEAGIGLLAFGVQAKYRTDGFGFNFVPLRSALDYGGSIYSGTQSPDIENSTATTVMNNTPFDAVFAVADAHPSPVNTLNYNHSSVFNTFLINRDPGAIDTLHYRGCGAIFDNPFRTILGQEIGDESLYLNNFDHIFPKATYSAKYDILVNVQVPDYEYPSSSNPFRVNAAAYSREEPFWQHPSEIEFYSRITEAQNPVWGIHQTDGYNYQPPHSGIYQEFDQTIAECCNTFARKKFVEDIEVKNIHKLNYAGSSLDHHIFKSPKSNYNLNYQIFDFSGRLHAEGIAQKMDETKVKVPAAYGNKMVLIRLYNQEVNETFKIYQP